MEHLQNGISEAVLKSHSVHISLGLKKRMIGFYMLQFQVFLKFSV
jgi:hypothetical protein